MNTPTHRRPLKTRDAAWPHRVARRLAEAGVSANQVSVASVIFAPLGAAALVGSRPSSGYPRAGLLLLAIRIQLRLVCNLLDGLIAVENRRKSKVGDVYNDVPDRIADSLLLVAAGYAAAHPWGLTLGWLGRTLRRWHRLSPNARCEPGSRA